MIANWEADLRVGKKSGWRVKTPSGFRSDLAVGEEEEEELQIKGIGRVKVQRGHRGNCLVKYSQRRRLMCV